MVPRWKRWFGAAAVVLLAGAGCGVQVSQDAAVETGAAGETADEGRMEIGADASLDAAADVAVDAMLKEAETDAMYEYEEGKDADVVGNDGAELEAYGNAYVEAEL